MHPITKRQISITTKLPNPNQYAVDLNGKYRDFAFDEVRAPENKGKWRSQVFKSNESVPLDLEIGTGNGLYFAHHSQTNPSRKLVGIELKYKPLIQTIRRALNRGATNAAVARYHAFNVDDLFAKNELSNIYIQFPDPWVTPRKPKNRVVNRNVLTNLYSLQREGSRIEFKTDSREYYLWALEEVAHTPYRLTFHTPDLHNSELANTNFITQFERIFLNQGIEINYIRLDK